MKAEAKPLTRAEWDGLWKHTIASGHPHLAERIAATINQGWDEEPIGWHDIERWFGADELGILAAHLVDAMNRLAALVPTINVHVGGKNTLWAISCGAGAWNARSGTDAAKILCAKAYAAQVGRDTDHLINEVAL